MNLNLNLKQMSPAERSFLLDALYSHRHRLLKEVKNCCKFVWRHPDNPYFYQMELEARGKFAQFERFFTDRFGAFHWHRTLTRDS